MKTFEVWNNSSNPLGINQATHTLKADSFEYREGAFTFYDEVSNRLHSIVATPGMLIRTIESI